MIEAGIPWTFPEGDDSGVFAVAVCIEPDDANASGCLVEVRRRACRRAHRNRMVAAQYERHQIFLESLADHLRKPLAGLGDFVEILRLLLAVRLLFGLPNRNIADVFDLPAELLEPRLQARQPSAPTGPYRRRGSCSSPSGTPMMRIF